MNRKNRVLGAPMIALLLTALIVTLVMVAPGRALGAETPVKTYTLDAEFDLGTLVNVNHAVSDQLQLDSHLTFVDRKRREPDYSNGGTQ